MLTHRTSCFAVCLALVGLGLTAANASAGELKRRGLVGVMLAPVPPAEGSTEPGVGAVIQSVVPDSAAAAAGLESGDIILKIDDSEVASLPGFMTAIRNFGGGDKVAFTVQRGDETITKEVTLADRPRETSDKYDVIYDSVDVGGARLRTYITKPKESGKFPGVLIIPSPSPQPVELLPQMDDHPYKKLIDGLTLAGIVTLRMDRFGVGDSEGGDPMATTLTLDGDAYRAAAKYLAKHPSVDSDRVFIFAMGMGSAVAPLAAKDAGIRGVVTFGSTIFRPAKEGLTESLRRMLLLNDPEDELIEDKTKLLTRYFKLIGEGARPTEALAKIEGLAEVLEPLGGTRGGDDYVVGIPYDYFMQMERTNFADAWGEVSADVLVLWGEADFQANRKDSELIAASVNKTRAGAAAFKALPRVDHVGNNAIDQEDSYLSGYSANDFNPVLIKTLTAWIEKAGNGKA